MKSSQKRLLLLMGIVALAFVGPINTPAANAVTIIVDEEGHGFKFDENGGRLPDLSLVSAMIPVLVASISSSPTVWERRSAA